MNISENISNREKRCSLYKVLNGPEYELYGDTYIPEIE